MRLIRSIAMPAMALLVMALPAAAAAKVVVKTKTYAVTGETGMDLVRAMGRTGPMQGFMTRSIAQTTYTVDWSFVTRTNGRACRIVRADPTLHLTYTYPRTGELLPPLAKRWRTFMAGTRRHERTHGAIAINMVSDAARKVAGMTLADDPFCRRVRADARRRIAGIKAGYEARQAAFDRKEHGPGGRVEKLVNALIAGP
jgi:predicted secreted Zn-dependent protease